MHFGRTYANHIFVTLSSMTLSAMTGLQCSQPRLAASPISAGPTVKSIGMQADRDDQVQMCRFGVPEAVTHLELSLVP